MMGTNKKSIFAAVMAAFTAFSMNAAAAAATHYEDVPENAWYAEAVQYVDENELMSVDAVQMTKVYFNPGRAMTRAEVADAIYQDAKLFGITRFYDEIGWKVQAQRDYHEIPEYLQKSVAFCFNSGIMTGDYNLHLYPQKYISRQDFAVVIERYLKYMEDCSVVNGILDSSGVAVEEFQDARSIGYWAKGSIAFCIKNGLMDGNLDGSFNPKGNITRAQMAKVLHNFSQKLIIK